MGDGRREMFDCHVRWGREAKGCRTLSAAVSDGLGTVIRTMCIQTRRTASAPLPDRPAKSWSRENRMELLPHAADFLTTESQRSQRTHRDDDEETVFSSLCVSVNSVT